MFVVIQKSSVICYCNELQHTQGCKLALWWFVCCITYDWLPTYVMQQSL